MKFGKEFAAQMVQEWQEAYMDYNYLKKVLKDILRFKQGNTTSSVAAGTTKAASLKRRVSLYRAFSGLTGHCRPFSPRNSLSREDEVILINAVQEEGGGGHYHTTFLNASEEGGEYELVFFRRLDDEFNKVVTFYKKKVEDVLAEADDLSKQMDALIALRIKVDNPKLERVNSGNVGTSSISTSVVHPINSRRSKELPHMEVIQEVEMSNETNAEDEEKRGSDDGNLASSSQGKSSRSKHSTKEFRPAPVEILDRVKINVEPENPVSTMKTIIMCSKPDRSYSNEELRKAEKLMAQAFVEFYQKLTLLKSYW